MNEKLDYSVVVKTDFHNEKIEVELRKATELLSRTIIDTREKAIREALIRLGWTPPPPPLPRQRKCPDCHIPMVLQDRICFICPECARVLHIPQKIPTTHHDMTPTMTSVNRMWNLGEGVSLHHNDQTADFWEVIQMIGSQRFSVLLSRANLEDIMKVICEDAPPPEADWKTRKKMLT